MNKNSFLVLMLAFVFSLSVSAETQFHDSSHNWNNVVSKEALAAISVAKAENKKAAKLGFEWRDAGNMLKKATKLAKEGKTEAAIKLANKAKKQGVLAQEQAIFAKGAGPARYF